MFYCIYLYKYNSFVLKNVIYLIAIQLMFVIFNKSGSGANKILGGATAPLKYT